MPVSSLRFRIEGDNASALRALSDVKREAHGLGADIEKLVGEKLKTAFSATVVEEVVRRTGEWATELQRTSRELGVTSEQLQTLRVLSERAGVAQDKIFTFYSKLEAKATQAANGNKKLLQSFHALGVNISDLKGPNRLGTSDLFQKTLGGIGNEGAIQSIYGAKSFLEIQSLSKEAGGRSLAEYQKEHRSQIVPEGQVNSMAAAWINIVEDLKSIGNKLQPLVALVLSIVDGLLKMVNGLVGTISSGIEGSFLGIKSLFSKRGSKAQQAFDEWTAANQGRATGVGKGLLRGLSFGLLGGKPSTSEVGREGEGAGEGIATVGLFGLPKIPGTRITGNEFRGVVPAAARTILKRRGMGIANDLGKDFLNPMTATEEEIAAWIERNGTDAGDKAAKSFAISNLAKSKGRILNLIKAGGLGLTGLTTAGVGANDINASLKSGGSQISPPTRQGILSNLGLGGSQGGAGSGNLAIGGVFGHDLQTRMLQLSDKMVDLLQQIVENTNPVAGAGWNEQSAGLGD